MASIAYGEIYSKFYARVNDYKLATMPEDQWNEVAYSWLHSVASKSSVRRLFSSLSLDDEIQIMTYDLKMSVDDETDEEFVKEVFSLGMIEVWVEPQLYNPLNTRQMFGSNQEKFYSQSAHSSELRNLYSNAESKLNRLISDRNATWNSYLDTES